MSRSRQKSTSSIKSTLSLIFSQKPAQVEFSSNIQDYELLQEIGGVDDISFLYSANFCPANEKICLKYTDMSLSLDYEYLQELETSVTNTVMCKHKNILPYYHIFVNGNILWIVTPNMPFGTCRQILQNHLTFGFEEKLLIPILHDIVNAVVYLHSNHLIHNDIRAENILICEKGHAQLGGLRQMQSLMKQGQVKHSVFSVVGENLEWAAPEVVSQNQRYDYKADIYSIGMTALELAFAKTPYDNWAPLKILLAKSHYNCPALPEMKEKKLSAEFWNFVSHCLHRNPHNRPSAMDLLNYPLFENVKPPTFVKHALKKLVLKDHVDEVE